ncbi:MAG: hypothetical protein IJX14_12085 [Clostridia bacterium]|nr:hypothetical protein [Clostridia bacterium]
MKKFILVLVSLILFLFLAGCGETTQRIPFKEAESMYTMAYANEDHTEMTQIDITEDLPWYDDLIKLFKRINGWSEEKMIPAAYHFEEDGKLMVTSDEMESKVVFQIKLPDTDPNDDIREHHIITFALRALTDNRCYLSLDDNFFRFTEETEHTVNQEEWLYEDKAAWEMIAELEAAIRETAGEMAEAEKQETE